MAAVLVGLDEKSCSTAPSSTGPALLLQLCCLQYISCCSTAGGCSKLLASMWVCVCACVHTCVIITFLPSFQTFSLSSLLIFVSCNCVWWNARNVFKSFSAHLIAFFICIHPDILSHTHTHNHNHTESGNLHVIICILYKPGMPDRPPTAQLVRHLADTLLTWCITDRASVITRDWQTGKVTFRPR